MLRALQDAGCPAGVVTTKYRHRVEDALERDGLRGLVDVVVGLMTCRGPSRRQMGCCGRPGRWGSNRGLCLCGRFEVDAMAAQAAGMAFVAVLSGRRGRRCSRGTREGGVGWDR